MIVLSNDLPTISMHSIHKCETALNDFQISDAGGSRLRPSGAERIRPVPSPSRSATRIPERASKADPMGGAAIGQWLQSASLEGRRRCKFSNARMCAITAD